MAVLLVGGRVPRLLARHRPVVVNAVALVTSGLAVLTLIFVHHPAVIFLANLCLGVGLILRWIACDTWVIALAPQALRGRIIGISETLMGCGIAAGPVIIALCGSAGAAPFLACLGLLAIAGGALLRARYATDSLPAQSADAAAPDVPHVRWISLMAFAAFVAGDIETSSISLLPVLSLQAGWPVASTLALGVFAAGGMLMQLPVGYLADRVGHRGAQRITALAVALTAALLFVLGHQRLPLLGTLFLLGGAAGGMITLAVIEAGTFSPQRVGAANARVEGAYTVGSIIGPPTLGLVTSATGPAPFPAVFVALGAAFFAASLAASRAESRSSPGVTVT
jgi:MFS family permease